MEVVPTFPPTPRTKYKVSFFLSKKGRGGGQIDSLPVDPDPFTLKSHPLPEVRRGTWCSYSLKLGTWESLWENRDHTLESGPSTTWSGVESKVGVQGRDQRPRWRRSGDGSSEEPETGADRGLGLYRKETRTEAVVHFDPSGLIQLALSLLRCLLKYSA